MESSYFITAIGTDVGKTVVSAVLCRALGLDYWKPVQAGSLENSDSIIVSRFLEGSGLKVHFEKYRLETPCSPHLAAEIDNVEINVSDFVLPNTKNGIIVEGAGGLLVPLNRKETNLDLIKHLALPVIVVSKNYLGSINHTLLTIERLKADNIRIRGIIFNGDRSPESERIIREMTGVECLPYIANIEPLNRENVAAEAERIKGALNGSF